MLRSSCPTVGKPAVIRDGGLTLIEVLITLSVATIILAIGVPVMAQWMHASVVRHSASDLVAVLQVARAEALARNTEVRATLGDDHGRALWTLGCVTVNADCPGRLRGIDAPSQQQVRWGAATAGSSSIVAASLPAGLHLPATVTFNAAGAAPAIARGTEVSRIDVFHATDTDSRRLVVMLNGGGRVRICDPLLDAGRPMSCP